VTRPPIATPLSRDQPGSTLDGPVGRLEGRVDALDGQVTRLHGSVERLSDATIDLRTRFGWAAGGFAAIVALASVFGTIMTAEFKQYRPDFSFQTKQLSDAQTAALSAVRQAATKSVSWTPTPKTEVLGKLPFTSDDATALALPDSIPKNAIEILLFISGYSDNSLSHPEEQRIFRIWANVGDQKPAALFQMTPSNQLAVAYNSDNVWLPMPTDRQIYVQKFGPNADKGVYGTVNVIGFRTQ
jgi:hypothetical protein